MSKFEKAALISKEEADHDSPARVAAYFANAAAKYPVSPVQFAEQIAKSNMVIRNVRVSQLKGAFLGAPQHESIDKYYPLAEGSAIYVDDCFDPEKEKACEKKKPLMREAKLRYVVLKKDSDLLDIKEQLENQDFSKEVKSGKLDNRRNRTA